MTTTGLDERCDDTSNARNYCEHGRYVGNWATADHICGLCEEGVTVAEMHEAQAAAKVRGLERLGAMYDLVIATFVEALPGFNALGATGMVAYVWDELRRYGY